MTMTMAMSGADAIAAPPNPYGFIDNPVPGSPFAGFAHLFLLLWFAAVVVVIVRAARRRRRLVRHAMEHKRGDRPDKGAAVDARALDRALNFLDRTVLLSLLFGLFATLVLVGRTLLKIGVSGRVDLVTVAGPWSEALQPLLLALCVSLLAGMASTLLYLPEHRIGRFEH